MDLSFKSVCNKENKRVICNMTSSSSSFQSTHSVGLVQDECFGKNYSSFLDFTRNYEQMSGIFVPCCRLYVNKLQCLKLPSVLKLPKTKGAFGLAIEMVFNT